MLAKKKLIFLTLLGVALWSVVAWLFIKMPLFVIELLPDLLPISVFAFLIFLIGLLSLTLVAASIVRRISPQYTWSVILMAASLIVLYNLSPLAPAWKCYGKRLYVVTANAAGQYCTTVCTSNKKKPCSGWSSCWDKDVSCSSSGFDQDGRPCQGCCFSCDVVCEEEPDPDPDQPPTISGYVSCSQLGNNGWCTGASTLNLTAADPQNYTLTISGTINGSAFTCPAGNNCSLPLPEGNGPITYKVTASNSGLSSSTVSTTWKRDGTAPVVNVAYPSPSGANGWHITAPVNVSVNGSDAVSGLASAMMSINGGAWQSTASLTDGTYAITFLSVDNAGNSSTLARTVKVDSTAPTVSPVIPSPDGLNGWFVTAPVVVSVNGVDTGSGLASALVSVDGGGWQPNASLSDGMHTINFRSTDLAGNTATVTRTVKVDTGVPSIVTAIAGTAGNAGWYISETTTTISASDPSGIDRIEYNSNAGGWQNGSSVVNTDGINTIEIRAYDVAGNMASETLEVKVDTVAPSLSTAVSGTSGRSGWYVSQTTTTLSARDGTSGVDHVEYNQNDAGWQVGSAVVSTDGVNTIVARAYDFAGNMSSDSVQVKVDTVRPTSIFSSPANGSTNTLVRGSYSFAGSSSDTTSGVSVVKISLDGTNWLPLVLSSGSKWSYVWNTLGVSDGIYPVVVRATDIAGNEELVASGAHISLLVNNAPPHIKLTPEWFIWEAGSLLIKTDYFPLKDGLIVIADPQKRWPKVEIPFGEKYPAQIQWDRRFANGILAQIGNYAVTVSACNLYDLCSEKSAIIKIPQSIVIHPVTPVSTSVVEVVPESTAVIRETSTPFPSVVEASAISTRSEAKAGRKPSTSLLTWIVLIALMWAIASAAVSDTRPIAIHAVARTISQKQKSM
jgi:hypothetical protein